MGRIYPHLNACILSFYLLSFLLQSSHPLGKRFHYSINLTEKNAPFYPADIFVHDPNAVYYLSFRASKKISDIHRESN